MVAWFMFQSPKPTLSQMNIKPVGLDRVIAEYDMAEYLYLMRFPIPLDPFNEIP